MALYAYIEVALEERRAVVLLFRNDMLGARGMLHSHILVLLIRIAQFSHRSTKSLKWQSDSSHIQSLASLLPDIPPQKRVENQIHLAAQNGS
jgi:hypothetical protein